MLFRTYGQAVLTLHERSSRILAIRRQPSKHAAPVAAAIQTLLASLPSKLRQTITFDNGSMLAHLTVPSPAKSRFDAWCEGQVHAFARARFASWDSRRAM